MNNDYTLPHSSDGKSSLVCAPPWYFGGRVLEVVFETDRSQFSNLLPAPLEFTEQAMVGVSFVEMTSVNSQSMAFERPERSQFYECLIKLKCAFNGSKGWYVPTAWVDKDFSLMRGFLLGFGKKLGRISITKLHRLNPMIGGAKPGAKIAATCEGSDGSFVRADFEYVEEVHNDIYAGLKMYTTRHYPSACGRHSDVHELVELVAENYVKDRIWSGKGTVDISVSCYDEVTRLVPGRLCSARIYDEGFKLLGTRVVFDYNATERSQ